MKMKEFDQKLAVKNAERILIEYSFIGSVRRFLFVPWDSWWNAFVRDITAKLWRIFH